MKGIFPLQESGEGTMGQVQGSMVVLGNSYITIYITLHLNIFGVVKEQDPPGTGKKTHSRNVNCPERGPHEFLQWKVCRTF